MSLPVHEKDLDQCYWSEGEVVDDDIVARQLDFCARKVRLDLDGEHRVVYTHEERLPGIYYVFRLARFGVIAYTLKNQGES